MGGVMRPDAGAGGEVEEPKDVGVLRAGRQGRSVAGVMWAASSRKGPSLPLAMPGASRQSTSPRLLTI